MHRFTSLCVAPFLKLVLLSPPLHLYPLDLSLLPLLLEDCPLSSRGGATRRDVSRFALTFFFQLQQTKKRRRKFLKTKKQTKQRRFVLPDEQKTTLKTEQQHTPKIFKTKP